MVYLAIGIRDYDGQIAGTFGDIEVRESLKARYGESVTFSIATIIDGTEIIYIDSRVSY